jgi:hypothetical protein
VGAVLVIGLGLLEAALEGLALHRTLLGRVPAGFAVAANSAGALVGTVIPFEAGEVAKGVLLRRRDPDTLAGLVVWNYVWKLSKPIGVSIAFVVGFVATRDAFSPPVLGAVALGCAALFVPYLLVRLLLRANPNELAIRLLGRVAPLRAASERYLASAVRLDADITAFLRDHRGPFRDAVLLQAAARLVGAATLGIALGRLAPETSPLVAGVAYAALSASDLVVTLLPARVGVGEGAWFVMFDLIGLDPALGLAAGLVMRMRATAAYGLLAAGLFWERGGTTAPPAR